MFCSNSRRSPLSTALAVISLIFAGASVCEAAATRTWDGGGADGLWSNPLNWDGDTTVPSTGDDLVFAGTLQVNTTNDLPTVDISFNSITFSADAGAFIIGGSRITLTGDITNNDDSLQTITLDMILSATSTCNAASGNVTLVGVLSGAGGLTKTGTNTLTLTNANTYGGATTITNGSLRVEDMATPAIPNAGFETPTYGGGAWAYTPAGADWTFGPNAGIGSNGSPWVTTAPEGTQAGFVQNNDSFSQSVTIGAEGPYDLTFRAANRPGYPDSAITVTIDGSTVQTYPAGTFASAGVFNPFTIPGIVLTAGPHALAFVGTQNGADSATAIDQVALTPATASLPSTTAVDITAAGASLVLTGTSQTIASLTGVAGSSVDNVGALTIGDNSSTTFAGVISGAGGITKVGAGTLTFSGINTYAGTTTVNAGVLTASGGQAIPDASAVVLADVAGAELHLLNTETLGSLAGGGATGGNVTSAAACTLTLGANNTSTAYAGIIAVTGGLIKTGTGVQTLSGSNTYAGGTTISGGTLRLGADDAIPDGVGKGIVTVNNPGVFDLSTFSDTINGLTGNGRVLSAGGVAGPVYFTTNAGSGISGAKTYTHLLDFIADGSAATVNGVAFTAADRTGANWSLTGAGLQIDEGAGAASAPTFPDAADGTGMNQLFRDFYYNGTPTVLTLSGLTAGTVYETRLYNRAFGGPRIVNATFDPDGTGPISDALSFDQDGSATPSYISYRFLAASDGMGGALPLVISLQPAGAGTYHFYGLSNEVVSGSPSLTVGDTTNQTFSGTIAGTGELIKQGSGSFTLSGANTFSGGLSLTAGTLNMNHPTALGSGTFTIADGTTINNTSGSAIVMTANNTQVWNGNFTFPGTNNLDLGTGAVALGAATRQVTVTSGTLTVGGVIGGAGGLTKSGVGTLILSSAETYAGATTINGGTVTMDLEPGLDIRAWKNGGGQADIDGARFSMIGPNPAPTDSTYAGTIGYATQSINMNGNDQEHFGAGLNGGVPDASLRPSGYQNNYTVEYRGKLRLTTAGTYRFATTSDDGSALWIDPASDNPSYATAQVQNSAWQGMTTRNSNPIALAAGVHDIIIRHYEGGGGNGLQVLWDPTGGTSWSAIPGNIFCHRIGAMPETDLLIANGATLNLNGTTQTVASLSDSGGGGSVTDGSTGISSLTLNPAGGSTTFSGVISNGSGTVLLTKNGNGTQILSGTNTYTGATTVSAGTLLVSGSTAAGSAVTVNGTGTLGGTGTVNGTIAMASSGTLAPGMSGIDIGALRTATVTMSASSTYSVDLDGTGPAFDQLNSSGTVTCAGTLTVANIVNAADGKTYTIINAASVTGIFSGLVNGAIFPQAGHYFQIVYTGTQVTLTQLPHTNPRVWTGGGIDNNWTTPANWTLNQIPGVDDDLIFAGTTRLTPNNDYAADTRFNSITFDNTAGVFTIGGNRITLTADITNNDSDLQTLNLPLLLKPTSGVNTASGDVAIDGIMSGTGGLTKTGAGTLFVTGTHTCTGTTTISAGTLQVGNGVLDGSISASSGVTNNAALIYNVTGSETCDTVISGTGSLTKIGAGDLTVTVAQTYTGPTIVSVGTLKLRGRTGDQGVFINVPEAAGYDLAYALNIGTNTNLSGGVPYSVDNTASIPDGSFARVGYYLELQKPAGSLEWVYVSFDAANLSNQANKLGVPIASTGEFYHYNNGTPGSVTITNMNVASNVAGIVTGTNINTGVIQFWPSNYGNGNGYGVPNNPGGWGLGDDGANAGQGYGSMKMGNYGVGAQQMLFSFNNWNGGTYDLGIGNGSAYGYFNDYTFSGNAGSYTVKNLYVVVGTGTGGGNNLLPTTTALSIASGATLDLGGSNQEIASLSDQGGGGGVVLSDASQPATLEVNLTAGSTTFSGTIDNGSGTINLVKSGGGEQVLSGANTYTGSTTVNGGTLRAGVASVANTSGAFGNNSAVTLADTAGTVLDLADFNTQLGSLTGGGTTGGNVTMGAGNLTVGADNTSPAAYDGVISGTGGVTKIGTGTLTLGGTNTYDGATAIDAGALLVTGSLAGGAVAVNTGATLGGTGSVGGTVTVANGGTLTPGTDGTNISLLGTGAVTMSASSLYLVDLDGGGPTYDQISSSDAVVCDGTLMVTSVSNSSIDDIYYIVHATTSVSGEFNGLPDGAMFTVSGRTLKIAYTAKDVTLTDVVHSNPRTWDGGGGDNNWTTAANWDLNQAPVPGDDLVFAGTTRMAPSNNFPPDTRFGSITFSANADPFIIGGNRITLEGSITNNDNDLQTLNLDMIRTGSSSVPWQPNHLPILTAWYDADDASTITETTGAVSQWADKSGNALHLTQGSGPNQPTTGTNMIGGLNAIYFNNAASQFMNTSTNPFGGTVNNAFVIFAYNCRSIADSTLFMLTGSPADGNRWQSHAPWGDGNIYFDCGGTAGANRVSTASGWGASSDHILSFYGSTSDNVQQVFADGSLLVGDSSGQSVSTVGNIIIGGDLTNYDNADLGECVIINGTVSAANRQRLEGYLAHKWGLTASLPVGHPYKAQAPTALIAPIVDAAAGDIAIGGVLSGSSGLTKMGTGVLTLANTNTYTGTTTINAGTLQLGDGATDGSIGNSAGITNKAALVYNLVGSQSYTNVISGSGTVTKSGVGTLSLGGANSFVGGVSLDAGTLNINNATALGTGTFTIADAVTIDNTSGAAITMTTNNPQTWNGDFTFTGTNNLDLGTGAVAMGAATRQVTVSAGTLTIGGPIAGAGGLTKTGAGKLTLANTNTYAGATTIDNGILAMGLAAGLDIRAWKNGSNQGDIDGARFDMASPSPAPNDSTYAGTIGYASQSINMSGNDQEHWGAGLNGGVPNSSLRPTGYQNTYTVEYRGKLNITTAGTYSFATTSDDGSALWIDPAADNPSYATATVQNSFFQGMTTRSSAPIALAAGLHDIIIRFYEGDGGNGLQAQWDPTGGTTWSAIPGNLFYHRVAGLPATDLLIANGGTLDLYGTTQTVTSLADSGGNGGVVTNSSTLAPAGLTIGTAAGTTTFSGSIDDSGGVDVISLTKTGTSVQILTGTSSYTGTTTISAGTLQIGNGVTDGSIASSTAITNNATLAYNLVGAQTYSHVISGTGVLTKTGAGALTLSAANTYSGGTTIDGGTLRVTGQSSPDSGTGSGSVAVNAGGTLSGNGRVAGAITVADNATAVLYPNSSATLTLGDNLTLNANTTTRFDLSSSAAGANDKVVLENKTLTCAGSITINSGGTLDGADYVLFDVGAGNILGSFNAAPVWVGTTPRYASLYSIVVVGNQVLLRCTPISITLTSAANAKVYDGTVAAATPSTLTAGTLEPGDVGTWVETYDDKNVGTGKTLTPAGTVRDPVGNDVTSHYSITCTSAATGTITPRPLTVTATGIDKIYDGNTTATVDLHGNQIGSDTLTFNYSEASFNTPDVGTNKPVTVTGITIGGADAGNYDLQNTTAFTTANIVIQLPVFVVQPASVTRNVYDVATFSVTVLGTPPLTFQWRKNGVNIPGANAVSYTTPPVPASDNGAVYSVVVRNAGGSAISNGATLTVVSVGDGLIQTRYANPDFTNLVSSQVVPNVNTNGLPGGGSIRWSGSLLPITAGTYHFYLRSTGGVRLWLDGVLVIDGWSVRSDTTSVGSMVLATGRRYAFQLDFAYGPNPGLAVLEWGLPGWGPVPGGPPGSHVVIPQSQFFTAQPITPTGNQNARPRTTNPEDGDPVGEGPGGQLPPAPPPTEPPPSELPIPPIAEQPADPANGPATTTPENQGPTVGGQGIQPRRPLPPADFQPTDPQSPAPAQPKESFTGPDAKTELGRTTSDNQNDPFSPLSSRPASLQAPLPNVPPLNRNRPLITDKRSSLAASETVLGATEPIGDALPFAGRGEEQQETGRAPSAGTHPTLTPSGETACEVPNGSAMAFSSADARGTVAAADSNGTDGMATGPSSIPFFNFTWPSLLLVVAALLLVVAWWTKARKEQNLG